MIRALGSVQMEGFLLEVWSGTGSALISITPLEVTRASAALEYEQAEPKSPA